jgi:hypothetical protein
MWCKCSRGIQALLLSTHQCEELDKRVFATGAYYLSRKKFVVGRKCTPKIWCAKKKGERKWERREWSRGWSNMKSWSKWDGVPSALPFSSTTKLRRRSKLAMSFLCGLA